MEEAKCKEIVIIPRTNIIDMIYYDMNSNGENDGMDNTYNSAYDE